MKFINHTLLVAVSAAALLAAGSQMASAAVSPVGAVAAPAALSLSLDSAATDVADRFISRRESFCRTMGQRNDWNADKVQKCMLRLPRRSPRGPGFPRIPRPGPALS